MMRTTPPHFAARKLMLDRAAIDDIKRPRAQIKATDAVKRRISAENTTYRLAAHLRRNRRGDRQTMLPCGAVARVANMPFSHLAVAKTTSAVYQKRQ